MAFPSNPNDNDIVERFGRRFRYKASKGAWDIVSSPIVAPTVEAAPTTSSVAQADNLPMSGNEIGAMAYVQESNRLYVWNGSGWFEVALVNTNPSISGGVESTYSVEPGGDPVTITLVASDPEEVPLTWSYTITSGSLEDTTITNNNNVFTITPGSTPSTFDVTFTASDGVNTDTSSTSFSVALAWSFQGSIAGYSAGHFPTTYQIQRYSFATDENATDFGDLTVARLYGEVANSSSLTHGYTAGGNPNTTVIDKFTFAVSSNATDVGDLVASRSGTPAGNSSPENGYVSGGNAPGATNTIQKFSFAVDGNATDIGDLTEVFNNANGGQNTSDTGYVPIGTGVNKISYSSDTNAVAGTVLFSQLRSFGASHTGETHGYVAGGISPSQTALIEKFPFASEGSASTVGNLTGARYGLHAATSTVSGYCGGGSYPNVSTIDKFPFATDTNATAVGNLLSITYANTGMQY